MKDLNFVKLAACRLKLVAPGRSHPGLFLTLPRIASKTSGPQFIYQAAILAKERRQLGPIVVATLRIIANVQGNVRDRFGRLDWSIVISRSIGLKPGGNCLPVHQGLLCIQSQ